MSRRILSLALGASLTISSSFGAFAATTPDGLSAALSGQPGVTPAVEALVSAVQSACGADAGGVLCFNALLNLLAQAPADLNVTLKGEITQLANFYADNNFAGDQANALREGATEYASRTTDNNFQPGLTPGNPTLNPQPTDGPGNSGRTESEPTQDDTNTSPGAAG